MCDTFVALPNYTASRNLIFAKNSDREPNEAQAIVQYPARTCTEEVLQCTYIKIPQVKETYEVILSKPFQMWGAEMGVNEHGVVIGNEAVFTKVKAHKKNTGLTGMDMLRLALERTHSAELAMEYIIKLLRDYGQDANGGYRSKFYYHNSFLIADPNDAWVLETAGKHWVAKRVDQYYSISNGLTIGTDSDRVSEDAQVFASKKGWRKIGNDFNFAAAYSDRLYTRLSNCSVRQQTTSRHLGGQARKLSAGEAMGILAKHNLEEENFHPSKATTASVCMHATGLVNRSQTTGSMVAEIRKDGRHTVWLTGTSMPCLSVYKPYFFKDAGTLYETAIPGAKPDESLWWKAERVHRKMILDYQKAQQLTQAERKELQFDLLYKEWDLIQKGVSDQDLKKFSNQAQKQYFDLLDRWEKAIQTNNLREQSKNLLYRFFQNRNNNSVYLSRKH
jgi:dipeptidase